MQSNPSTTAADRYWAAILTAILVVAAVTRIAVVRYANDQPDRFMWPDSQRYLEAAAHVAAGHGPMVSPSNRTGVDPGYPMLLSWPLRVWPGQMGTAAAAARWANVAAGLATVVFTAYLGRLLFGSAAGLIAAAILAILPIQVYFHALVLTEVIYTTLLIGSLYALARYMRGGSGAHLFGCAIGLGLGALIRSSGLLLPVLLLPLVGYAGWRRSMPEGQGPLAGGQAERPRFRQRPAGAESPANGEGQRAAGSGRLRMAATAVFCFCICYSCVLLPTAWRNYRILGAFVPVRTGVGTSLLEAVGPWADGGPGMEKFVEDRPYPPDASEYVRDRIDRQDAVRHIRQDPGRFLRLAWVKLLRTWNVRMNLSAYRRPVYDVLAMVSTIPVYGLVLIGWLRHRRPVWRWSLVLAPAVYFTLMHMVFVGSVRYRYPAVPALLVLAGAALVRTQPSADRRPTADGVKSLAGPPA